jgi:hypothetical protein
MERQVDKPDDVTLEEVNREIEHLMLEKSTPALYKMLLEIKMSINDRFDSLERELKNLKTDVDKSLKNVGKNLEEESLRLARLEMKVDNLALSGNEKLEIIRSLAGNEESELRSVAGSNLRPLVEVEAESVAESSSSMELGNSEFQTGSVIPTQHLRDERIYFSSNSYEIQPSGMPSSSRFEPDSPFILQMNALPIIYLDITVNKRLYGRITIRLVS